MTRLRPIAGPELVKLLCNAFGFSVLRIKGSHATLNKDTLYVTVPLKEIRVGLLSRILKDCGISREEYLKRLWK